MAGIVRAGDHGAKTTWGRSAGARLRGESEVEKWSLYLDDDVNRTRKRARSARRRPVGYCLAFWIRSKSRPV